MVLQCAGWETEQEGAGTHEEAEDHNGGAGEVSQLGGSDWLEQLDWLGSDDIAELHAES